MVGAGRVDRIPLLEREGVARGGPLAGRSRAAGACRRRRPENWDALRLTTLADARRLICMTVWTHFAGSALMSAMIPQSEWTGGRHASLRQRRRRRPLPPNMPTS